MNKPLLEQLNTDAIEVEIHRVETAEIDEMWSYVGKKKAPRWLWHALDHQTGKVLACVRPAHRCSVTGAEAVT